MAPIDHSNTKVLLIGVSEYPEDETLPDIPNIKANLKELKKHLIDPDVVGIPEANIMISLDENKTQIERKLNDIAEETRDNKYTFLVYYAGHGLMNPKDFKLYLSTYTTSTKYLKSDSIWIDDFRHYIHRSLAARKIVILDCCHSGGLINAMANISSLIQTNLNDFQGTYVMTSAAEDAVSLFPVENPILPTYFTGKFLEVIKGGIVNDNEYCSLRDIYNKIENDFREVGLPKPQQSNYNTADQLYFSKNKKFTPRKEEDELAWEVAVQKDTKWDYINFKRNFPSSRFAELAKQRLNEIEETEYWHKALKRNGLSGYDNYLEYYPDGQFVKEAIGKLDELRKQNPEMHGEALANHGDPENEGKSIPPKIFSQNKSIRLSVIIVLIIFSPLVVLLVRNFYTRSEIQKYGNDQAYDNKPHSINFDSSILSKDSDEYQTVKIVTPSQKKDSSLRKKQLIPSRRSFNKDSAVAGVTNQFLGDSLIAANVVSASLSKYVVGAFGGISDLKVTCVNRLAFPIDLVVVEIQYVQENRIVYKTENIYFRNVAPISSSVQDAPKSARGIKIKYKIACLRIESLKVHTCNP